MFEKHILSILLATLKTHEILVLSVECITSIVCIIHKMLTTLKEHGFSITSKKRIVSILLVVLKEHKNVLCVGHV